MLDLMVSCWSQEAKCRPSASQVVSIASAPEFTHLLDVISLDHSFNVADAITVNTASCEPSMLDDEQPPDYAHLWIGRSSSQLDIVRVGGCGYTAHSSIEGLPDDVTVLCQVNRHIWLGDTSANIHAYSAEDKSWIFSYCLDCDSPRASVRAICALEPLGKVGVALSNGRLFLCRADTTPTSPVMGEGSFILTELAGFTGDIFSVAKLCHQDQWSLWCGGSEGMVSIFTFRDDGMVTNQETVSHFLQPQSAQHVAQDVTLLQSDTHPTASSLNSLWTYVQPGCIVYHWHGGKRQIVNQLDCSKLVPCSESLESISIEEHLSPSHCQVSAVAVCGGEIFVGTAWGCVIVAEAGSMRPITVFRPHESQVRAIVPLVATREPATTDQPHVMLATIGQGYRNLLQRYTHLPKAAHPQPNRSVFCLLWKSHDWINS